jgi:hypothetical protein
MPGKHLNEGSTHGIKKDASGLGTNRGTNVNDLEVSIFVLLHVMIYEHEYM